MSEQQTIPIPLAAPSKGQLFSGYLTLHAANPPTNGDLEMQVEPTSTGPKMSRCMHFNYCAGSPRTIIFIMANTT